MVNAVPLVTVPSLALSVPMTVPPFNKFVPDVLIEPTTLSGIES